MKVKNEFFEKLKSALIGPEVEKVMKSQALPPNSLEPKQVWEKKLRDNLMEIFSGQPIIDKTTAGFEAIVEGLQPNEVDKCLQEWRRGVELWIEKSSSKEDSPPPNCLQEIMEIPEETLVRFYEVGNHYFEHEDYHKASDVFSVIVSIDPARHNVWMALGLAEARLQHWEAALISFSMASIMDSDSPYPYIYSAECCLKDKRNDEAKVYIDLAKEAVESGQFKNKQELLSRIQKIQ